MPPRPPDGRRRGPSRPRRAAARRAPRDRPPAEHVGATTRPSNADHVRLMRPPSARRARRGRIRTEAHQAVNSAGPNGSILAGCLLALLAVGAAAPPERVGPTRGELRLLAIRAS